MKQIQLYARDINKISSTVTHGTSNTVTDSTQDFLNNGVEVGMKVRKSSTGVDYVIDSLTATGFTYVGSGGLFLEGTAYEILGNYERLELFEDETISLTQSIQNIKDPAKIFTAVIKEFTIPASNFSNKFFKHYYNFNIDNSYDARLKKEALIKLNGVDFQKGKIKLNGVKLKNNKPDSYNVTFIGDLVELKDLIGEDLLSDLTWLDNFEKTYSSSEVLANLKGSNTDFTVDSVSYTGAIKTALFSCGQKGVNDEGAKRFYYDSNAHIAQDGNLYFQAGQLHGVFWKDLKYSIAVYLIVKAIEKKYNITFSTDWFDTSNADFKDLMMLMHRKKGYARASYKTGVETYENYLDNMNTNASMTSESYTYGGVTYPLNMQGTASSVVVTGFPEPPPAGFDREYYYDIDLSPDNATIPYNAYLYYNSGSGEALQQSLIGVTGNQNMTNIGGTSSGSNGTWTVKIEAAETIAFGAGDIDWRFPLYISSTNTPHTLATTLSNSAEWKVEEQFTWKPTQQLPEMKVMDFLKGLFRLWNLTAFVQEDNTIKVQPLDSFYASGTTIDITQYVDVNLKAVNVALPYKQVNFEFEGQNSFLAKTFNQLNNRKFGNLEYKGVDDKKWVGVDYKIAVPFEKVLYEKLTDEHTLANRNIQYGFIASDDMQSYIGKPILHYCSTQYLGVGISFLTTLSSHSEITGSTAIFMPSNQRVLTSVSSNSINFYSEIDEWTKTINTNSLFEQKYKTYIQDVFNKKRRIIKITAQLPNKVLLKYNLSDKFVINNKEYKINSITTNLKTGESSIELLNDV